MTWRWAGLVLQVFALLLLSGPPLFPGLTAAAEEPIPVAPGSVVRWSGDAIGECRLEGRRIQPLDGECLFPIDLRRTGTLVVERVRGGTRERRSLRVGPYPYPVQRLQIEDDSRVHLSPQDLERVQAENRRIGALWSRGGPRRFDLPLVPPLDPLPEGGRFGARRIINGESRSPHTGADYSASPGEPVRAAAAGNVALAEEHFFAGNSVFLDHGDGLISMYFHLDRILVEAGQEVEAGETVGRVGATGRATGPHLHFGLRWHGARIDPSLLLGPVERLESID